MRKCSVSGCNSQNRNIKVTLFSVTNANKSSWESAIRSSINNQVKDIKYVCSEHFLPEDINTTYPIPSDVIEVRVKINRFLKEFGIKINLR